MRIGHAGVRARNRAESKSSSARFALNAAKDVRAPSYLRP